MLNAIPIDTRPNSPIQRLSKAYFRKNAVANRISMTATQPTPRRPMSDSSSKAFNDGDGVGVGASGCGGAIGGGGGSVTGSGAGGLTGSVGGGSGPGSRFGSTTTGRPASAASSCSTLLLV